jgi:hypothetical protein
MPGNAITRTNGADVLEIYDERVGAGGAENARIASAAALKKAVADAQSGVANLIASTSGAPTTASQLNVYG